jgi:hypothetical protein
LERVVHKSSFEKGIPNSKRFEKRKFNLRHFCSREDLNNYILSLKEAGEGFFKSDVLTEGGHILTFVGQSDSNGLLKNIYFNSDQTILEIVLFDVFLELSLGKSFEKLVETSLREIDSYLRDTNDRPSFGGIELSGDLFDSLKEGLMEQVFMCHLAEEKILSDFASLPLIKKLGLLKKIIYDRVSPLLKRWGIDIELVLFEEGKVVCSLRGSLMSRVLARKSLGSFIQKILRRDLDDKKMNVFLEFFYN